jgi:hypothetical protein
MAGVMTVTTTVLRTGDEQLRRFVVRIDLPDGATGTGVLVAPGWVLTCAHVVEGCDVVSVVPDRGAAPDGVHAAVPPWGRRAGSGPFRRPGCVVGVGVLAVSGSGAAGAGWLDRPRLRATDQGQADARE